MQKGKTKGKGAHLVAEGQWGGEQILASVMVERVNRQHKQTHTTRKGGGEREGHSPGSGEGPWGGECGREFGLRGWEKLAREAVRNPPKKPANSHELTIQYHTPK
eukprot:2638340-Rhodomonas_salina.1